MKVLYKYVASRGIDILDRLRVKVTPPNQFNDPFEVTPRSCTPHTKQRLLCDRKRSRKVYEMMRAAGDFSGSWSQFKHGLPRAVDRTLPQIQAALRAQENVGNLTFVDQASQYVGIICFSASPNDIVMWGHYGESHEGLVIGFDVDDQSFPRIPDLGVRKVKYSRARYPFDGGLRPASRRWYEQLNETLFHKSTAWSYEKESRLVLPLTGAESEGSDGMRTYYIRISASAITEVIFGCRTTPTFQREVRNILSLRRFRHVKVLRADRHPDRFSLVLKPAQGDG